MTRTPEQQRAIVDRLLAAWLRMPNLRFGQLVSAAADRAEHDAFYIRDEALCEAVEALAPPPPLPSTVRMIEEAAAAVFGEQLLCLGMGAEKPERRAEYDARANECALALARIADAMTGIAGGLVTFSFTDDYPVHATALVRGAPIDGALFVTGDARPMLRRCQIPERAAAQLPWWTQ